nr:CRISPR-associated endonuclease Cas3'' [Gemmatimonadota bacterium]
ALITPPMDSESPSTTDGDPATTIGRFVELTAHLDDAVREAATLCAALEEPSSEVIARAMRWHDIGKIHPAFRTALLDHADGATVDRDAFWAKSGGTGRLLYRVPTGNGDEKRPYFRHELASLLAWLEHGERDEAHDLTAYLIAAHHGKVRLGLRALPTEKSPPDDRLYARGVWHGDVLPAFEVDGMLLPETALRLDVMRLGEGAMGASWSARTLRLLTEHGPFRLSWLETLVRIADWRASEEEAGEEAANVLEQA